MTVARNERIYGKKLGLTVGGVDYWSDVSKYELTPDEKTDAVTFGDAASGVTPWKLKGSAIQSTAADSFWKKVWDNAGKTLQFALAPHGNKIATVEHPHFTGTVTIGTKPPISSEAGDDKGSTFDFEWDVTGEPTLATTESTMGTGSMEDD